MGQALDDVEAGKERGSVERARRLARSAADSLDHFAFEDLPPFREAVLDGARADDGVEREKFVGEEDDAVEARRRGLDVVRAELLIAVAGERCLKARELLVAVDTEE